jgi:hypothetical protein
MGTGGYFAGDKAAGHEADHSSPSSADVKIRKCIIPFPHIPSLCDV